MYLTQKGNAIDDLNQTIHQTTKFSEFENEMARREFIVSPILFKLSYLTVDLNAIQNPE